MDDDDAPTAPLSPSKLGAECLRYLREKLPSVASSAAMEEEAVHGSLGSTAERLVRVLAEELRLDAHAPAFPRSTAPAPAPASQSLSASTLTLLASPTAAAPSLTLTPWRAPSPSLPEPPGSRPGSGALFQPLVFLTSDEEPFFQELFCLAVNLLAKTRREMRARTARDQDKVFRVLRRQVREALAAQVRSWGQLEDWLSELPYSAVAALWEREHADAERSAVLGSAAAVQLRESRWEGAVLLVRQQRLATLRAGTRFQKMQPPTKGKRGASGEGGFTLAWLGQGDRALLLANCTAAGRVLGASRALPLASITAVVPGKRHLHRSKKSETYHAFSILLDPYESEIKSVDLVAADVRTMEHWVDGLNMLLGKEIKSASVKRDADCLVDMEVRLQLMELDGVGTPIPSEPPEVPPLPPSFDFVT